jgi:hypothetical protein
MEIKEVIGLESVEKDEEGNYEGHCVPDRNYTYILPSQKVCFLKKDDLKWTAIVERVNEREKKVYVSQVNWFYMHHIIKFLYKDVKIMKRYPGRLTLCVLRDSLEEVDKNDVKKLSELVGEKIVIKVNKEEIKIQKLPSKNTENDTVAVSDRTNNGGSSTDTAEEKLIDFVMNRNEVDIKRNGYRFFLTAAMGKSNISFVKIETINRRFEYFYKIYETNNLTEKRQVVSEAAKIFLGIILKDRPL